MARIKREQVVLEGRGDRLSAEELGQLAKRLAAASSPPEAAHIKERLTWGFYGQSCWPAARAN